MSEEKGKEKKEVQGNIKGKVVKMSDVMGAGGAAQAAALGAVGCNCKQKTDEVLTRSVLELHNDMRQFRKKTEGLDRVIFSLQQGINKGFIEVTNKVDALEQELLALTKMWQEAVGTAEKEKPTVSELDI